MQPNIRYLSYKMFEGNLSVINGISFTRREIDVLAFLISGRSDKKIAAFLSIAPKTVETHTRNIMSKLRCNSRGSIIDFIQKSGKYQLLKQYYINLLIHNFFEGVLQEIAIKNNHKDRHIVIIYQQNQQLFLLQQITYHLNLAGYKISLEIKEEIVAFQDNIQNKNVDYTILVIPSYPILDLHCLELLHTNKKTSPSSFLQNSKSAMN